MGRGGAGELDESVVVPVSLRAGEDLRDEIDAICALAASRSETLLEMG